MKYYDHPEVGRLSFDYTILDLADGRSAPVSRHLSAIAETDTREQMERLLAAAGAEAPGLAASV